MENGHFVLPNVNERLRNMELQIGVLTERLTRTETTQDSQRTGADDILVTDLIHDLRGALCNALEKNKYHSALKENVLTKHGTIIPITIKTISRRCSL